MSNDWSPEIRLKIPVLHVHGQPMWHDSVYIIGNRAALESLRRALDIALLSGKAKLESNVCTSDGEGYRVEVILRDKSFDDEAWAKARLPYYDDCAKDHSSMGY